MSQHVGGGSRIDERRSPAFTDCDSIALADIEEPELDLLAREADRQER